MTKIQVEIDCDSELSIIDLIKLTSRSSLRSKVSSERLCNRSRRLLNLNRSIVNKFEDLDSINDWALALALDLAHKPWLNPNNTNCTLFSRNSTLSLSISKTSSNSSLHNMSNIAEELESRCDEKDKNIFYIANTPSPKEEELDRFKPLIPQNSLFPNGNVTTHTLTEADIEDDSEDDISEYSSGEDQGQELDQEPYLSTPEPLSHTTVIHSDGKSTQSDDSEWVSVSEDDTKSDASVNPLNFRRKPLAPSRHFSSDTIVLEKETSPSFKPKSLLSGLFLNEMAKQAVESQQALLKERPPSKPILKRSSTTGIITVGQDQDIHSHMKVQRPSIMFQKKFTSSVDISKNYPHHKNTLVKNHIVNDSKIDDNDGTHLSIKQRSIVGISDFNVISSKRSNKELKPSQGSSPKPSIISTSLTKYGYRKSSSNLYTTFNEGSNSIKTMISKSSLNLSSFFQSKRYGRNSSTDKYELSKENNSKVKQPPSYQERELKSGQDIENKIVERAIFEWESIESKGIESRSLYKNEDTVRQHESFENQEILKEKMSPNSTQKTMLDTELSKSLKDSIIIDYKLGKVPLPEKTIGSRINYFIDEEDTDDYYSKGW